MSQSREDAARARKGARYASRRHLWQTSTLKAVRCCGRGVQDEGAGVVVGGSSEGHTVVQGICRCGSIWAEPVCSAKIRNFRADEIQTLLARHLEAGGQAIFVTLTVRHFARHELADLLDAIRDTYKALLSGRAWVGDRKRGAAGHRDRLGIPGVVRATEVTWGETNGFHPHLHLVVLLGARQNPRPARGSGETWDPRPTGYFTPDPDDVAAWQADWRRIWTKRLTALGMRPSDEHGVRFDTVVTEKDAEAIGTYVAKIQDGKLPGAELARGDLKTGRQGNMAAFELLARLRDLVGGCDPDKVPGHGDAETLQRVWWQYETATKGRRAIEWSRGLRAAYEIDGGDTEEDDHDAATTDETAEITGGVQLSARLWAKVCRRGLDLAVEEAWAEGGAEAVRALLKEAGIGGALLTELSAEQIEQLQARRLANLAARREAAAARRLAP